MNKRIANLLSAFILIFSLSAIAAPADTSIVSKLERPQNGAVVKVHQSPELSAMLLRDTVSMDERLVTGYRIQVFSDNSQKKAKEMAQERAKTIETAYPELTAYVTFNSPFWRVRVGNFSSYEEAAIKLRELKKMYPQYHDMRIVKDNIVEKY